MELYHEAQKIIFEEVPIFPITYSSFSHFVKPVVENISLLPTLPFFRDIVLGPEDGK